MKKTLAILFIILSTSAFPQNNKMYACFQNDENSNLQISICYNTKTDKYTYVKYKGQDETIPIFFSKKINTKNPDGGHPAYFWAITYTEKYRGKITGIYTFTNAGTHGLDVTYKRKRDGKEFYFFLIEGMQDIDNAQYKSTPCF